jgi:hypothetical protein
MELKVKQEDPDEDCPAGASMRVRLQTNCKYIVFLRLEVSKSEG